jgi:hypothetical protein
VPVEGVLSFVEALVLIGHWLNVLNIESIARDMQIKNRWKIWVDHLSARDEATSYPSFADEN